MPTAKFEIVTPARAEQLLATCNSSNRKLRHWWAQALSQAMTRGEFMTTHQGLAFDSHGNLIDGQHRLKAITLAGMAVTLLCVYGVPDASFSCVDIGIKRSNADTTGLPKRTAEVCRLAARFASNNSFVFPDQVRAMADLGFEEIHSRLDMYCSTNVAVTSSAPARLAACLLVMDGVSESYVFQTYTDMVQLKYTSLPPVALALLKQKDQKKIFANRDRDLIARMFKVLSPKTASLTKLQVDETGAAAAADRVRQIIKNAVRASK